MAGRNDPCPCGSGKKYKKCCLALSANRDHLASDAQRVKGLFADSVREIHHLAIDRFGLDTLEQWSWSYQSDGDPQIELEIFREFIAFHVPFQDATNMAQWFLAQVKRHPNVELIANVAAQPYRILQIGKAEPDSVHELKDLLTSELFQVRPCPQLKTNSGQCLYGKLLEHSGLFTLLSAYPVTLDAASTKKLVQHEAKGRKKLTPKDLLDTTKAAELYQVWRTAVGQTVSKVNRRVLAKGAELNPTFNRHLTRDIYRYSPNTERWLVNALNSTPELVRREEGLYHYESRAAVKFESGTLRAESLSVSDRDALERILATYCAALLTFQEREEANLLDHLMSGDLSKPVLLGVPNFQDVLSPEQIAELTGLVEEMKYLGLDTEDFDDDDDDDEGHFLCVSDAVTEFLQERGHTVSLQTFRRDREALHWMEVFLNIHGWKQLDGCDHINEMKVSFVDSVPYFVVLDLLEEILEFYRTTPLMKTASQEKGAVTALRQFIQWMSRNDMLAPQKVAKAMQLFKK